MRERDPVVLRRMLALRNVPILGELELAELATLADNVGEIALARGETVAVAGQRLAAIDLILDGRIATRDGVRGWGPGQIFGALEVLAGDAPAQGAVAATMTRVLRLRAADVADLVEDNFGLLRIALRSVASAIAAGSRLTSPPIAAPTSGALDPAERLYVLRRQPPFATGRVEALAKLAQASDEMVWPAGSVIVRAGDPATIAHVVRSGELRIGEVVATTSAFGLLETLAERRHGVTIEAATEVRTLATTGAALFDVLEDHSDLGLAMLAAFARMLVQRAATT